MDTTTIICLGLLAAASIITSITISKMKKRITGNRSDINNHAADVTELSGTVMKNEIQIDVLTRDTEEIKGEFALLAPNELQKWIDYLKKDVEEKSYLKTPLFKKGVGERNDGQFSIYITNVIPIADKFGVINDYKYDFVRANGAVCNEKESILLNDFKSNI